MSDFLNKYIDYIKEKNLSNNTIEAYVRDISKFEKFLEMRNINIDSVQEVTLMNYVHELGKLGKSNASIARNIISIRNFYRYLTRCGVSNNISLFEYEIPKFSRELPNILTVGEVDKLLSAPDTKNNKGIRDKAMLELMYGTGIKVSELLDLKLENIDLKLNYIICSGSKGRERIIPIGSFSVKYVSDYLEIRTILNKNELDYLFLNSYGTRMTRQGFWKILKQYGHECGIEKEITVNTLRHSFAVHLIQNGADMRSVQELLGYKDISAAQMYINVLEKNKLGEVYKKAHPRA
jgi:integrase/recombinase XerD